VKLPLQVAGFGLLVSPMQQAAMYEASLIIQSKFTDSEQKLVEELRDFFLPILLEHKYTHL